MFEISIVCHVLCSWFWRGVGVSLFFGGCSGLSVVFSRASGVSCVSRSFCSCLLGWGAGCGGVPGFGVWRARVSCFLLVGGRVWGASARARFLSCPVLAVVGSGGRVRGARVARFPWWGSGCARFLLLLVVVGVFGCCFFRPVLLVFSWFPVLVFVVLPGVGGLWGVSGWVRGCFFSGFCCTGPGLFPVSFCGGWFGFGLGFVWRV